MVVPFFVEMPDGVTATKGGCDQSLVAGLEVTGLAAPMQVTAKGAAMPG